MMTIRYLLAAASLAIAAAAAPSAAYATSYKQGACGKFTIAVLPDTQNYVDFRNQKWSGFALDATEQFYEQMRFIKANARSNGGDIVFASHVGDVWQNYSKWMDPGHSARGFQWVPNAGSDTAKSPKVTTRGFEIPAAAQAFDVLDGALPFSVVPGNHDYDALWTDPKDPPREADNYLGTRHVGGLEGYLSAFSSESHLFKNKDWYVASHDGGADSAQIFTAGQCRFLHIGLQYHAPDASLAWASDVVKRYPGLPVILTTHDYLHRDGKRHGTSNPNNQQMDPIDNDPVAIWDEFVRKHDQIFMVLSGHIAGQGYSVDRNEKGGAVYQIMADYQARGQSAIDAGAGKRAIGDGWMRLMEFDLDGAKPSVQVRTYSTHYKSYASDMAAYSAYYKQLEGQGKLTDRDFVARDEFQIDLADFHRRFGK